MASGAKLPKTNLNLIQDSDVIDHADINAIAQAVEENSVDIASLFPVGTIPNGTDLHTLNTGLYSLGNTGVYVNGVNSMYGILDVKVVGPRKYLTYHHHTNAIFVKVVSETSATDWRQI